MVKTSTRQALGNAQAQQEWYILMLGLMQKFK